MKNRPPKSNRKPHHLVRMVRGAIAKRNLWLLPCLFACGLFLVTVVPGIAQPPSQGIELPSVVQQVSTPEQLLPQGRQNYEAGKFAEAANLWEQAAQGYAEQGAILNQAQALNYLSSAYQELGQWEQAEKAIATSLNLLQNSAQLESRGVALLAQALNTQGNLQLAKGQTEAALETWKQAEATYDRAGNQTGKLGTRINQAQALQSLGQYRRAKRLLEQLAQELQDQPNSLLKAEGLRSLGVALQTIGDLVQSKAILEESWAISQEFNSSTDTSATLLSIGNIARDLQQYDVALAYYQEAAQEAREPLGQAQAQLNQLSLWVDAQQPQEALPLVPEIESNLSNLSPSRASVYARVNLAESLMKMRNEQRDLTSANSQNIARILATAVQQAKQLQDPRAEAYALTQLGKLYEQTQQWQNAKGLTEEALKIAQRIDAADITARSAWQLGRLLKHQGNITEATAAYRNAFENLQSLRSDLVAINSEVQFSFKESVEPIYREFVGLLLQPNANQADLKQARQAIEALQLAELDNFFGDACLGIKPVQIDEIDAKAAVIYPIILSDRLEVIASLPNQPLRHYATPLPSHKIEATLEELYSSLYPGYSNTDRLQLSQQVYDWLIRPAEADLDSSGIKTLVFVLDGFLRNLPMGALYDGKQYLVEKYDIALSPGLQLFPQGLERQQLKVLAVGLTEARQGFSPLPSVEGEMAKISSQVSSEVLLNQEFTRTRFQSEIEDKSFPVVHLATHGQFSSNPAETFLLTWDDRIDVKDFDILFQKRKLGLVNPIELLVLSACQTAAGDNRATLGLAGLALRSGAHSTLASLWSVNDESTAKLMSEFYRQLTQDNGSITKAEALRQAQLSLLKDPSYKHPYFWASFVLIGNWL
ncbi:MAG TPA: hypothetical protein DDZ80_04445 [Cyanobacteria bacterium UBA8803]|nr:hypothetical protein [Cyanobacteria bacterium UBA9273]HBL57808.1 hypothetical protein [Cyanobacteria bacterium UBA8803]